MKIVTARAPAADAPVNSCPPPALPACSFVARDLGIETVSCKYVWALAYEGAAVQNKVRRGVRTGIIGLQTDAKMNPDALSVVLPRYDVFHPN